MKFLSNLVVALAALPTALAVDQKISAIVYFNDSIPDFDLEKAKEAITQAGGKITHNYQIIKGFAVIAPRKTLEDMQAWGANYNMTVEEDKIVTIQ